MVMVLGRHKEMESGCRKYRIFTRNIKHRHPQALHMLMPHAEVVYREPRRSGQVMADRNAAVSRSRKSRRCPWSEYSRIEHRKRKENFQRKENLGEIEKWVLSNDKRPINRMFGPTVVSTEGGPAKSACGNCKAWMAQKQTTVYGELWS